MSETGTGTGEAAAAAAAAAGNKPWFDGADADTVGYLQNRGWDKVDAKAAALGAVKAHREAEKLIGAPPDKIVRLPKDASDAVAIKELRTKLGVPDDAKGYDFSKVKFADGKDLDAPFVELLGSTFQKNGVPKDAAPQIAADLVKYMEAGDVSDAKEAEVKLAAERDALDKNWGNNKNQNLIVAKAAAKTLGIDPEAVAALEKQVGYAKVMEMFRDLGVRMGEDKFIRSEAPGGSSAMTAEQAQARLTAMKSDAQWNERYEKGDRDAIREFDEITRIVTAAKRQR